MDNKDLILFQSKIGESIAANLNMKMDNDGYYHTGYGKKTAYGLYLLFSQGLPEYIKERMDT